MVDEKKIDHLEAMSNEELDNVAGGIAEEMADDSRFLNSLNGSCDRYGTAKIYFKNDTREELRKAWSTVGIVTEMNNSLGVKNNKYYLNGQEITQEQARQHAMEATGHHMSESEWKW